MHTTKLTLAAAAILALLAAGFATRQVTTHRADATALAEANRQVDALRHRLAATQQRATAAESAAAEVRQSLAEARTARAAEEARAAKTAEAQRAAQPARPSVSPRLSPEAVLAGRDFVARHPEVKRAVLDVHRTQIAGQFGPFFRQRAFTPEQIETFTQAMQGGAGVFRMVPDAEGKLMVLSTPTWGDADKRREEDAQLVALLGPDGIRELQAFIQLAPARRLAAQLAGALYFTPTPLTAQQAEQFVRTVAPAATRDGARSGATDWTSVLARARTVLLEPQLATLARFQAQERYTTAMNEAIRRGQPPAPQP